MRSAQNRQRVQKDARNMHERSLITLTCHFHNLSGSEKITRKETLKIQLSRFGRQLKSQQVQSIRRRLRVGQKDQSLSVLFGEYNQCAPEEKRSHPLPRVQTDQVIVRIVGRKLAHQAYCDLLF